MLAIVSASTGAIAPRRADTIAKSISVSVMGSKLCVATDLATLREFFLGWLKFYNTQMYKKASTSAKYL